MNTYDKCKKGCPYVSQRKKCGHQSSFVLMSLKTFKFQLQNSLPLPGFATCRQNLPHQKGCLHLHNNMTQFGMARDTSAKTHQSLLMQSHNLNLTKQFQHSCSKYTIITNLYVIYYTNMHLSKNFSSFCFLELELVYKTKMQPLLFRYSKSS